jgi:DNA mismatch endonuclease Vsr
MVDRLSKEQRSRNMRAMTSSNTKMERLLAHSLWNAGLRYRKNNRSVIGSPDLTFKSLKVAIFVDGEFFHGKDWETEKYRIKSRREFWWPKIENNIRRDQEVNKELSEQGWIILRFWSQDVRKNVRDCLLKVEQAISERRHANKVL